MGLFNKLFGGAKKDTNQELPTFSNFNPSDKLMDEDQFWKIIQTTKNNSNNDYEKQFEEMSKELYKLTPDDLILFGNRFRYLRGLANTWGLWGAIYIIQGGCGDDSFNDFREWVIGQGEDFYYKTIKDPETLSELDSEFIEATSEFEGLGYIYSDVFKKLTGQEMPYPFQEDLNTKGQEWSEDGDDLKNMFPKISAKYPYNI